MARRPSAPLLGERQIDIAAALFAVALVLKAHALQMGCDWNWIDQGFWRHGDWACDCVDARLGIPSWMSLNVCQVAW
jgi:hypothetical protein